MRLKTQRNNIRFLHETTTYISVHLVVKRSNSLLYTAWIGTHVHTLEGRLDHDYIVLSSTTGEILMCALTRLSCSCLCLTQALPPFLPNVHSPSNIRYLIIDLCIPFSMSLSSSSTHHWGCLCYCPALPPLLTLGAGDQWEGLEVDRRSGELSRQAMGQLDRQVLWL